MSGVADDGATIYYDDVRLPPTYDLMGRLCVVGLPDDSVLVKKLRQGRSANRFDLYNSDGSATLTDQEVIWAARVRFIAPP